jgi:hypothetical protein
MDQPTQELHVCRTRLRCVLAALEASLEGSAWSGLEDGCDYPYTAAG